MSLSKVKLCFSKAVLRFKNFSVIYFICGHAHVAGEGQSVFSFLEIRLSGLGSTEVHAAQYSGR